MNESAQEITNIPFRELIGSTMFLATTTRPGIMYAVSYLAKFVKPYTHVHWNAAKSLLLYFKDTPKLGLRFNSDTTIVGYTDSDRAGDALSRKSRRGYVFHISRTAFSWKSKRQSVGDASSVEAEYISKSYTVRDAIWV